MAEERRPIDGFTANDWGTGALTDVDELVADADAAVVSTGTTDGTCTVTFTTGSVGDSDTVTDLSFVIRAQEGAGSAGTNRVSVTFQGTTVTSANLSTTFSDEAIASANWTTVDFTAAQLAADVTIQAVQQGKAESATWEVDCCDMVITFTAAGAGGGQKESMIRVDDLVGGISLII